MEQTIFRGLMLPAPEQKTRHTSEHTDAGQNVFGFIKLGC